MFEGYDRKMKGTARGTGDLGASTLDGLPKLLAWPGGKSRSKAKLLKAFPPHKNYVEPFVGGGSVFFEKDPAPGKEVIGDASAPLIEFYKGVARGGLRKCSYRYTRPTFEKIMAKYKRGGKLTACEYLILNKLSFAGKMHNYGIDPGVEGKSNANSQKIFARLPEIERRLRGVKIVRGSFEKTMRSADSPGTLHYLDPPYEGSCDEKSLRDMYRHSANPADVKRVAKAMRGEVVISYGDHPDIRRLFCGRGSGFKCSRMDVKYSMDAPGKRGQKHGELVIVKNRRTR